ncbi:hypothetical protein LO763_08430 [Glycomyces sp. A-F 0318]|uniref:hypothetical protein n=1 Tax=Glycomyces amatae TaxID=2881355 RepID=UPI001E3B6855|nr:hypothetical protein [Glycomyces amatae]MCD0443649.1 hypothetical protein [Glycomyces amatae]
MGRASQLNDRQRSTLRLIGDGNDLSELAMAKRLRHRSLLLLQALAAAAEERGWQVRERSAEPEPHYSGIRRESEHREGWIWVEVHGCSYTAAIDQQLPQTLDAVKSQSLKIELPRAKSGTRWRWAGRKTGLLEDRLPEIMEGLAARAAEERERTAVEAREAVERQRAREKAETDARSKALQRFYAETLYRQVSAFGRAWAISAYCDAVEEQIAAADPATPELQSAAEWLEWARSRAAEIDPLQTLPTMPAAPAFTAEQLASHLKCRILCAAAGSAPFGIVAKPGSRPDDASVSDRKIILQKVASSCLN